MDDITEATAKLVAAYKQWAIGTGQTGFVLPKGRFKDSSERNYNLKNSRIRKFLQYEEQTFGINLDWSASPRFEWKVIGGTPGKPVPVSTLFAIYNTKAEGDLGPGECLIFLDRTRGGDIGWPSSKTWGEQLHDLGIKLAYPYIRRRISWSRSLMVLTSSRPE